MNKLKRIIQKTEGNSKERREALRELAKDLGVSTTQIEDSAGRDSENVLIERIEQRYMCLTAWRTWKIALISAMASVFSALAAWIVAGMNVCFKKLGG